LRAKDYGARRPITVVAVGGTQLTGGVGGVVWTLIGVLVVGSLFNVFNLDATLKIPAEGRARRTSRRRRYAQT
jgi:hypothetical protein